MTRRIPAEYAVVWLAAAGQTVVPDWQTATFWWRHPSVQTVQLPDPAVLATRLAEARPC